MRLLKDLREDAKRLQPTRTKPLQLVKLALTTAPYSASTLHRLSYLSGRAVPGLGRLISRMNLALNGIDIDFRAQIGPGVLFQHPVGVVIGRDSRVGAGATFMSGVVLGRRDVHNGPDIGAYPTIGNHVLLGTGAVILGSVSVGSNSKIGARALILCDVPSDASITGVFTASTAQNQG